MTQLAYANTIEDAEKLLSEGFEPVECSFGRKSVVGKFILDHHGEFEKEEPVSTKAAKLALSGTRQEKFVVTGTPDADQSYAVAALSGQIPIRMVDAEAIAEIDIDPIGRDLTSDRYIRILLFNKTIQGRANGLDSSLHALNEITRIYNGSYDQEEINSAIRNELERYERSKNSVRQRAPGRALLVRSNERSFDFWYRQEPIVITYNESAESITIGLCPKPGISRSGKTGYDILGPEGLTPLYPKLDEATKPGWGGRKEVGGSPRNIKMSYDHAKQAFSTLLFHIDDLFRRKK